MRVPYEWLKQYVDVDLPPEELAERLTMAGLEVDRVEYPWPGIVTAEIVWLERIKGSDHLSATRVTTGTEEFSVVCGASNIHVHDKVPLARLGARVGELVIQEKKAMGVLSQGMLCSPRELGISDDHAGILLLPPDTPLGVPFGKVRAPERAVIDLDIKAHRGDLFCVLGVAREVASFTHKKLREPKIVVKEKGEPASALMQLEVRDADLCPRYSARVMRGIKIAASPQWMQDRLLAAGMRPINNVVDVTNYVMLELGQPLHAFDYDKVKDHTIVVRRAEPNETLTTLDDVTRQLSPEMLLITDPAGPNVIAGIFGGARVEVSEETTSLILEAAHFNPASIRRTSQALSLRTESSGRFEKNPDINLTATAIDRAAQLIQELAGGTVSPGRLDFYPKPLQPRTITFHVDQVEWLTGMQVTPNEAIDVLKRLGFGVEELPSETGEVVLKVTVPTRRGDVEESADLVEEVARIVGFNRVPSTIPAGPLPQPHHDIWWEREDVVRDLLAGAGLTEIVTYPLTSRVAMARLLLGTQGNEETLLLAPAIVAEDGAQASADTLKPVAQGRAQERRQVEAIAERLPAITLRNPASVETEALRLTLMPGLLRTLRENAKHEDNGLWFFELGRRYLPTPELEAGTGLGQERRTLGVVLAGPSVRSWTGDAHEADFYSLKGIAELLLDTLKIEGARFVPLRHPTFHPGRCATLQVRVAEETVTNSDGNGASTLPAVGANGQAWVPVGVLGEVHPEVAERFDLTGHTYLMELDLERLYLAVPQMLLSHAIPRYPEAERDLAIVVGDEVAASSVAEVIRAASGPILRDVYVFDVYTGETISAGKKSLAYRLTYQSAERTLTDSEIDEAQSAVVRALGEHFGAELRS